MNIEGRITIADAGRHVGETVQIAGWLYNLRRSGKIVFPLLRDGTGIMQCVGVKNALPEPLFETLRNLTSGSDVVWTTGVGQHQMWAMQYLVCDRPRTFITSGGLGTMGYGLPAAVGAKAARPDATVVCIDGDGCFQMTSQELATSVLEGLPIVVVIINNGWLGMVRQWQEMFYANRFAETHLTHQVPDYAQLAEAYGAAGFTIEAGDDLEGVLEEALNCGRTAVVDARCDPEEKCFPMIPAGAAATDVIEFSEEEAVEASP